MTPLCPSKIDCPGGPDNPVSNFSSEGVDPLIFVGTGWPNDPNPGPGHRYYGHDCYGNQISAVSQEDADFITYTLSRLCKNNPGTGTDSYQTHDQTACGSCPDGEEFCYTVPAYTFVAPIQSDSGVAMVAAADAHALAYAQQQVSILISRGRCDNTTCKILTKPPLPQGTVGTPYSTNLMGKSDNPLRTWSIVSGSLPPGLSLTSLGLFGNSLGLISGTPTQQGTYPFKVRMNCGTRLLSTTKNFSIKVNPGSSAHLALYWTLDEVSGDRVDSVNSVHLIPFINPPSVPSEMPSVAGINGLAVHGDLIVAPVSSYIFYSTTPIVPALTYSGKGFTIIQWIKVSFYDNTDPNAGPESINLDFLTGVGTYSAIAFCYGGQWAFNIGGGNVTENIGASSNTIPMVDGAWHMLELSYLPNGTCRYSIDAGVPVYNAAGTIWGFLPVSATFMLPTGATLNRAYVQHQSTGTVDDQDEILVTLDGVLTQAQITSIYNSGAGVTWPGIKTIVPT